MKMMMMTMMMIWIMMEHRQSKPHQSLSPLSSFIYIQPPYCYQCAVTSSSSPSSSSSSSSSATYDENMKNNAIQKLRKKYRSNIQFWLIFKTAISSQYAKLIWLQIIPHICAKFQKFCDQRWMIWKGMNRRGGKNLAKHDDQWKSLPHTS